MNKVPTYCRFDPDLLASFDKLGIGPTAGFENSANAYIALRHITLKELKGILTKGEISALISLQKGIKRPIKFQYDAQDYISFITAVYENEPNNIISLKRLVSKISNLTPAQVYFLREEILLFWESKKIQQDIDSFITQFI